MKPHPYVAVHGGQNGQQIGQEKPPPVISSPPAESGKWASWTENGWLLEVLSTLLGVTLVVALVVVLHNSDGEVSRQYGSLVGTALTLNTVVAILSATSKAALLWPVTECISQLKWQWFASERARPLRDMSTFDLASRSTWGGFELMWRTKFRTLAVIGSLLMFLSLAIDPLSQQLVSLVPTAVPSDGPLNAPGRDTTMASVDPHRPGSIPAARTWYDGSGLQQSMLIIRPERDINAYNTYGAISNRAKGAIQRGLYSGGNKVEELPSVCTSTNCTFDAYETLAVCTSFANVSSHLELVIETTEDNPKLPYDQYRYHLTERNFITGGVFLNASTTADLNKENLDDGLDPPLDFSASIAFRNASLPLANLFVFYPTGIFGEEKLDNGTIMAGHLEYGATEVLMEWCVQERVTEVRSGVTTTRVIREKRDFTGRAGDLMLAGTESIDQDDRDTSFLIAQDTHSSTSFYLGLLLTGYVTLQGSDAIASNDVAPALFEPFNVYIGGDFEQETDNSVIKSLRGTNQTGLETIFNNIAESMTNLVRGQGEYVEGIQFRQEIVVQVRWPWFIAHAILVAFCIILLAATIVAQRSSPLRGHGWKSSSLAVLHALDPALQQSSGGISSESALAGSASNQMVRLRRTEDFGWRLLQTDAGKGQDEARTTHSQEYGGATGESYSLSSMSNRDGWN